MLAAIDRLTPQGGTALGQRAADGAIAIVGRPVLVDAPEPGNPLEPQGPDLGYHGSAAVVLLSDGENTAEPDPLDVADIASSAGVRVYPIGLGQAGGHGARDRRLPGRDRAGRAAAARDRRPDRRAVLRGGRRAGAGRGLRLDRAGVDGRRRARRAHRAVRRRGRGCCCSRASACRWRGSGGRCSDGLPVAARPPLPARRAAAGRGVRLAAPAAAQAGGAVLQRRADPGRGAARGRRGGGTCPFALVLAALAALGRGRGPPAGQHGRAGLRVGR